MTKTLVDSNILVYSAQADAGEKHILSGQVIQQLAQEKDLVLSVQNLAEMCRVLTEKMPNKMDYEKASQHVLGFAKDATILSYSPATIVQANALAKQHKIHFFDALLIATMQENSICEILTENVGDFRSIKWLKPRNPFDEAARKKAEKEQSR